MEIWVYADPVQSPFDHSIFGSVGQPADSGIMLNQCIRLCPGRGDQCRPRSKEGLVTGGNSRIIVIEAPTQLPEFGRVSPINNRV